MEGQSQLTVRTEKAEYQCLSLNKIESKFDVKLLTFLGLDDRDTSVITLYLVAIGISIRKIRKKVYL